MDQGRGNKGKLLLLIYVFLILPKTVRQCSLSGILLAFLMIWGKVLKNETWVSGTHKRLLYASPI